MLAHNNKKPTSQYASSKGPPHSKIHVRQPRVHAQGGGGQYSLSVSSARSFLVRIHEFSFYPRLEYINTASVLMKVASDKRPVSSTEKRHFILLSKIIKKRDKNLGNGMFST